MTVLKQSLQQKAIGPVVSQAGRDDCDRCVCMQLRNCRLIRVVCPDDCTWWVSLKITPKSSRDTWGVSDTGDELQLKIQAVPEDGKANKAVLAFVAKSFGLAKSRVTLISGETSRHKRLAMAWPQPVSEPAQVAEQATGIASRYWSFETS